MVPARGMWWCGRGGTLRLLWLVLDGWGDGSCAVGGFGVVVSERTVWNWLSVARRENRKGPRLRPRFTVTREIRALLALWVGTVQSRFDPRGILMHERARLPSPAGVRDSSLRKQRDSQSLALRPGLLLPARAVRPAIRAARSVARLGTRSITGGWSAAEATSRPKAGHGPHCGPCCSRSAAEGAATRLRSRLVERGAKRAAFRSRGAGAEQPRAARVFAGFGRSPKGDRKSVV